jgi:sulfite reductase (ferredoxin)
VNLNGSFGDLVLQINQNEPSEAFATAYLQAAADFLTTLKVKREELIQS